jgi:hypothetical protein
MENRNTILNELKAISPVVAEAGFRNVYEVPAGYFEALPGRMLELLKGAEEEVSPVLPGKKDNPYQVPQGYFDNFAASVLQRIKAGEAKSAKEELETLSPLLSGLGKKMPFSTPDNFFEELSDNAVAGAKAIDFVNVELENLSPLMSLLKDKQVYEVPAGYFDQLPQQILQKVKSQPAKVVSMSFTRKVVRYAAAAVVAGLIVAAAWLYVGNGSGAGESLVGIEQISDEGLESYIENQSSVSPAETMVLADNTNAEIDEEDMKDMLADVSDEELQKYVDQYNAKDNFTN